MSLLSILLLFFFAFCFLLFACSLHLFLANVCERCYDIFLSVAFDDQLLED